MPFKKVDYKSFYGDTLEEANRKMLKYINDDLLPKDFYIIDVNF